MGSTVGTLVEQVLDRHGLVFSVAAQQEFHKQDGAGLRAETGADRHSSSFPIQVPYGDARAEKAERRTSPQQGLCRCSQDGGGTVQGLTSQVVKFATFNCNGPS